MSIYQFKKEDAIRFARENGLRTRVNGSELTFHKCPYCGNKTDDKNKFSINLVTGQFNCLRASCGVRGNMVTLSRDFDFSLGKDADVYYRTVNYASNQFRKFKDAHRQIDVRQGAIDYLANRGIPRAVTEKYEITSSEKNDNIIVFPFKDENGSLTFIKYRKADFQKGRDKNKEWCERDCKPILFGMNHCDPNMEDGRIVVTEGQIDSLSVVASGFQNAVSVPTGANGFTWFPYCYDFLSKFRQIIVMGDCENGKITLSEELAKRKPENVRVCRIEDYKGCKDANELLQKHGAVAVRDAIENSAAPNNKCIKPLASVKQVDIMKIPAIKTMMPNLDNLLDGGFRKGQLAVLTGKRGLGKSTIASMWAVSALMQKENCYFYSGELPDFFFRNWMDCQVTGKANHTQSDNDKLCQWYGDRAFIYDDTTVSDDEMTDLIKSIEIAIIQNGCSFIMIDNLMTALEDDLSTDLYRNQSKFIGKLSAMAKKYNVFILLIAHPRKTMGGQLTNDDIAGSSNITDKADLVFSFGLPDKEECDMDETHRRLHILKNRLTGKLTKEPIKLCYDNTGSRRIAERFEDFKRINFKWDNDPYSGFSEVTAEDYKEIPF